MYPEGTEQVYSNWTPRSNKYFPEATEGSVVFGIQYLIKKYLIDEFNQNFFGLPKEKAIEMFYRRVHNFVGIESVGYRHIEALYDLGYLPIRIKALPEGSICPIRVPMMTITNTKSEFFWLTNYLETLISCTLWMPCTSATRARLYKNELKRHAVHTGFPDAGAYQRYKILSNNWGHIVFNKVRDLETGKIKEFSIGREVNCYCPTFTFIDDLCDAGGTFLGELKVLKERYPDSKFEIIVCHAVNIEGLVKLCNNFDRVIITNSYCDYGYKPSNNNLTVIDVCG